MGLRNILLPDVVVLWLWVLLPDVGGGFEEYSVAYCLILGVGLRNILLPIA